MAASPREPTGAYSPPEPTVLPGIDASPVRAYDTITPKAAMIAEIESAKKDGDTLGGLKAMTNGQPLRAVPR